MSKVNQESLRRLLNRLSSNAEKSAEATGGDGQDRFGPAEGGTEYIRLHHKLTFFFDSHGAFPPEELADETLDRVMRILDEGEREIVDIPRYCLGVARNVLRETWKKRPPEPLPDSLSNQPSHATPHPDLPDLKDSS